MRAFVVAIGSELLGGDRLDSNSLRISDRLSHYGIRLVGKSVAGDSQEDIGRHLEMALVDADLVIVTGGLGPTTDDLTRQAVALWLGREMREDADIVDDIRHKFRAFGLDMPEVNRRQAMVIDGAEVLMNRRGSAPGLRIEHAGSQLFLFPGVPRELDHMLDAHLVPWLDSAWSGRRLHTVSFKVACRSESLVEEILEPVYESFDERDITVLASVGDIEIRLSVFADEAAGPERLKAMARAVRDALGRDLYAEDRRSLEAAVGELLERNGLTLVTAESCTGGLIGTRLTAIAGSSAYYLGGVVSYSNRLKQGLLDVSEDLLQEFGAVSEEVAVAMARGARRRLGGDYSLAVTGVAGPGGGSEDKPVGRVHIALAAPVGDHEETITHRRFDLVGDRERVRRMTSQWALEMLRRDLLTRTNVG